MDGWMVVGLINVIPIVGSSLPTYLLNYVFHIIAIEEKLNPCRNRFCRAPDDQ